MNGIITHCQKYYINSIKMSENQEPLKQTTKSNLIYELNEEEKTANIIGNDNASGEVMIQCSIKLGKKNISSY